MSLDDMYAEYVARQQAEGLPVLSQEVLAQRLLLSLARVTYIVEYDAVPHTCWHADDWDGMLNPSTCAGCAQAVAHPCHYCGYGHIFTTHNPEQHYERADPNVSDEDGYEVEMPTEWANGPHLYSDRI